MLGQWDNVSVWVLTTKEVKQGLQLWAFALCSHPLGILCIFYTTPRLVFVLTSFEGNHLSLNLKPPDKWWQARVRIASPFPKLAAVLFPAVVRGAVSNCIRLLHSLKPLLTVHLECTSSAVGSKRHQNDYIRNRRTLCPSRNLSSIWQERGDMHVNFWTFNREIPESGLSPEHAAWRSGFNGEVGEVGWSGVTLRCGGRQSLMTGKPRQSGCWYFLLEH